jgi:hypothetical protein
MKVKIFTLFSFFQLSLACYSVTPPAVTEESPQQLLKNVTSLKTSPLENITYTLIRTRLLRDFQISTWNPLVWLSDGISNAVNEGNNNIFYTGVSKFMVFGATSTIAHCLKASFLSPLFSFLAPFSFASIVYHLASTSLYSRIYNSSYNRIKEGIYKIGNYLPSNERDEKGQKKNFFDKRVIGTTGTTIGNLCATITTAAFAGLATSWSLYTARSFFTGQ